jgi:hypothetical protein
MKVSEIRVVIHCDLWSNLLSKISESGLTDLETAIVAERFRRSGRKDDICTHRAPGGE